MNRVVNAHAIAPSARKASLRTKTSWSSQFRKGKPSSGTNVTNVSSATSAAAVYAPARLPPAIRELGEALARREEPHRRRALELRHRLVAATEPLEREPAVVDVLRVIGVARR